MACQHEKSDPNSTVKTDQRKRSRIKYNIDLYSFQSHFIINFVLTASKLVHGLFKFPTHSFSHFLMNIIMAKTCSTTKVHSAKCHNFSNSPKFPAIRYVLYTCAISNGHVKFFYMHLRHLRWQPNLSNTDDEYSNPIIH